MWSDLRFISGDAMFIPGEGVFCNIIVQMAKMPTEEDVGVPPLYRWK